MIVAVGTAALTAILATAAGYGFGRLRFRGRGPIFGVTLLALMVPYQAILTPAFLEPVPDAPALLRPRPDERGGQGLRQ